MVSGGVGRRAVAQVDPGRPVERPRTPYDDRRREGERKPLPVVELQRRDAVQNQRRIGEQSPKLPGAPRLLAAMQSGLPPCSGVALGFDRLVMLATEHRDIREVLPFPENRA